MTDQQDLTAVLSAASAGDRQALEVLLPLVYAELRRRAVLIMQREREGHTLQPTALVHEAFLQLFDHEQVSWENRAHFFGVASRLMRRILVDHARRRLRDKRGGGAICIPLTENLGLSVTRDSDVLAVHEALKKLARLDARKAEIVTMRFFGGLLVEEVAAVLKVSKWVVEEEWTFIKMWLRRELSQT